MENPFDRSRRRAVRAGTVICVLGVLVIVGAAFANSDAVFLGIMVAQAGAILLAVQPLGWSLGAGLRHPALLTDRHRLSAALGGAFTLYIAWSVAGAGAGVRNGPLLTALLALLGLLGLAAAIRTPRPAAWSPPLSVPVGALLLLLFVPAPEMFQGTKPRAYYAQMRDLADTIRQWQQSMKADSGRYATALDTERLQPGRYVFARPTLEPSPRGYRAWVRSDGLDTSLLCGVYEGATPAEPATRPATVTCTPYPDRQARTLATWWLAGIVITGFSALLLRREAAAATT